MAEWDQRQQQNKGSLGSYGFALQALSEGLKTAVEQGWISEDEAKAEFRRNVRSLQQKREAKIKAMQLRDEADELEGEEDIDY